MFLMLFMSVAQAEIPVAPAPDCAQDNQSACIQELPGDWRLYSWVPDGAEETLRPIELELGAGIGADVAWQTHTGFGLCRSVCSMVGPNWLGGATGP